MRLEVRTETFQGLYKGKPNSFWLLEQGYEKQSSLCLDFGEGLNISSEISEILSLSFISIYSLKLYIVQDM